MVVLETKTSQMSPTKAGGGSGGSKAL
jgi:hypothetical protein